MDGQTDRYIKFIDFLIINGENTMLDFKMTHYVLLSSNLVFRQSNRNWDSVDLMLTVLMKNWESVMGSK